MAGKLDFTRLPTTRDITRVNNKIRTTEQNLRDAHATVAELERDLETLKAWIAPIRRLNTDILSLIFEMCGEDDWKTPLRIAATSRDWRDLVLATPRAWEFLPAEGCDDIKTIKLYLERSHPRPLHLYPPYFYVHGLISSISQRLECLTLDQFHDDMTKLSFPKLKRLVITGAGDVQISCIDATRFPALRHLVCVDSVDPLIDGDHLNLPPLLSLAFAFDADFLWLRVLQACQDTLISLEFGIGEHSTMPRSRLVFPRLISLEINDLVRRSVASPLDLEAPALETYIEHAVDPGGSFMRPNVKTTTQLRVNSVPESLMLPKVELIQLFSKENARLLLHVLSSNPAHFSKLETIEVAMSSQVPNDMVELMAVVNGKRDRAISLVFTSKLRVLRGMIKTQLCGSNMPCHYPLWDE